MGFCEGYPKHPYHPGVPSFPAGVGMHTGMADAAECDEVCLVQVDMVDMEGLISAADGALPSIPGGRTSHGP